jgi:hypothetical protein
VRVSAGVIRQRIGPAAWVVAVICTGAAVADESRRNCGSGGPSGALLIAAGVTAGLAAAVHVLRRRGPWGGLAAGLAVALGLGAALFVFALLSWVHGCAN